MEPPVSRERLLAEIKARLEAAHGVRLRGVVLYGSEARGTARDDSDIDLLVLLEGAIAFTDDLEANIRALYSLSLELGRPISPKPVDVGEYEADEYPLYQNAKREGVRI